MFTWAGKRGLSHYLALQLGRGIPDQTQARSSCVAPKSRRGQRSHTLHATEQPSAVGIPTSPLSFARSRVSLLRGHTLLPRSEWTCLMCACNPAVPGNEPRCIFESTATPVTQTAVARICKRCTSTKLRAKANASRRPSRACQDEDVYASKLKIFPNEALDTGLPGVQPSQQHPGAELQPKPSRIVTTHVNLITSRSSANSRPHPA